MATEFDFFQYCTWDNNFFRAGAFFFALFVVMMIWTIQLKMQEWKDEAEHKEAARK